MVNGLLWTYSKLKFTAAIESEWKLPFLSGNDISTTYWLYFSKKVGLIQTDWDSCFQKIALVALMRSRTHSLSGQHTVSWNSQTIKLFGFIVSLRWNQSGRLFLVYADGFYFTCGWMKEKAGRQAEWCLFFNGQSVPVQICSSEAYCM